MGGDRDQMENQVSTRAAVPPARTRGSSERRNSLDGEEGAEEQGLGGRRGEEREKRGEDKARTVCRERRL